MNYWAGLNSSTDQEVIRRGANVLINAVLGSHASTGFAPRLEDSRPSNANHGDATGDGARRPLDEDDDPQ
jgi:hypothetical protein